MPKHQLLFEFVALVSQKQPQESQMARFVLLLRYHHKADFPILLEFITALLKAQGLLASHQVNYSIVPTLIKMITLEADYFLTLLIHSKLPPLLARPISHHFQQWLKPTHKMPPVEAIEAASKIKKWMDSLNQIGYFAFLMESYNSHSLSRDEDVLCYFLEIRDLVAHTSLLTLEELQTCQTNIIMECTKLRRKGYLEGLVRQLWSWLGTELIRLLSKSQSKYEDPTLETVQRAISAHNNLFTTTFIQLLCHRLEQSQSVVSSTLLGITDLLMLKGGTKAAYQASLFLAPTFFTHIQNKRVSVSPKIIIEHYSLWLQAARVQKLPYKLLTYLLQRVCILYRKQTHAAVEEDCELRQIYQRQLIALDEQTLSDLAGLGPLLEDLQSQRFEEIEGQGGSEQKEKSGKVQMSRWVAMEHVDRQDSQVSSILESLRSVNSFLPMTSRNSNDSSQGSVHRSDRLSVLPYNEKIGSSQSNKLSKMVSQHQVDIILSLVELFQKRLSSLTQPSISDIVEPTVFQTTFLPLESSILSPPRYTLPFRYIPQPSLNFNYQTHQQPVLLVASAQSKKKIARNRGLLHSDDSLEMGYVIESGQSRLIKIYLTFKRPVNHCVIELDQRSIKMTQDLHIEINRPTVGKQLKLELYPSWVRLYQVPGLVGSQRFVRNKVWVELDKAGKKQLVSYDVPIYLYNLFHWPVIAQEDMAIFEGKARQESEWLPLDRPECLKLFLATAEKDSKGNLLVKLSFLLNVFYMRVLVVTNRVKVQIVNQVSPLVMMGILQVLAKATPS